MVWNLGLGSGDLPGGGPCLASYLQGVVQTSVDNKMVIVKSCGDVIAAPPQGGRGML